MNENHRDKTESKTPATEAKVSVQSEEKIGMPERKGTRKRVNSLATFFKIWATPLTILIAAASLLWSVYQFNIQQSASVWMQVRQEAASTAQTLDQQHQATLVGYLDDMSNLLLMYGLQTARPGSAVLALAEVRTDTALQNLDGTRKGTLIRFLWEAKLINGLHSIISLLNADLTNINLGGAILIGANFSGAILDGANLKANLENADLSSAVLNVADLYGANLYNANLTRAILYRANLRRAFLYGANLSEADLIEADLSSAVYLTQRQLDQVYSCKGATLPKGLTCNHNQFPP